MVFTKIDSATVLDVSASGDNLPLINTLKRLVFASSTSTFVYTPLFMTKPPPLDPTLFRSVRGLPSVFKSQIWKKLDIPPGENALAIFFCNHVSSFFVSVRLSEGKAL